jgi:uncharacterized membrane protein
MNQPVIYAIVAMVCYGLPIAQMGFVVAALLGIFILREHVTVRKVIGIVVALGALAVLTGS